MQLIKSGRSGRVKDLIADKERLSHFGGVKI